MVDNKTNLTPLIESVLSPNELKILNQYYQFLNSLSNGSRKPQTEQQKHFVQSVTGKVLPETKYELIWYKYSQLLKTRQEIDNLKKQICLLIKGKEECLKLNTSLEKKLNKLKNGIEKEVSNQLKEKKDILENLKNDLSHQVELTKDKNNKLEVTLHKLNLLEKAYAEYFGEAEIKKIKENVEGKEICPRCNGDGGVRAGCKKCDGIGWIPVIDIKLKEVIVLK